MQNQNNQTQEIEYPKGICHVHFLVYKDKTIRDIAYCSKCDAWICNECRPNIALRAEAMAISAYKKFIGKIPQDGYTMFPVMYKGEICNKEKLKK